MNVWDHSDYSFNKYSTEWDYTLSYGWCNKTFFLSDRSEYSGFIVSVPKTVTSWTCKTRIYTRFSFALDDSFWTRVNASEDFSVSYHDYYFTWQQ